MSSIHEGVSCDACSKHNFSGKRYKCLICYDFDLCAACYEKGVSTTQHLATHSMQCILTRGDYELYYSGESLIEPQSFACPYCGKLGFTELTLSEHVAVDHEDDMYEVVCPICAAVPMGDPNHLTEDLLNHINMDHRQSRDASRGESEESSLTRFSRRLSSRASNARRGGGAGAAGGGGGGGGGGGSASSSGRSTFQFGNSSGFSFGNSALGRDCMDPIAELLSQLSGVRRAAASAHNSTIQLQHLQDQLRAERESSQMTRQSLFSSMLNSSSLSAAAAAAAAASSAPQSASGHPLTASGNQASSMHTTNPFLGSIPSSNSNAAKSNANQQQQQQLQQQALNAASNPLTNQILELPSILQSTPRDNRFLLSKYDSDSISKDSDKRQASSSNQAFFTQDIIYSILMQQLESSSDEEGNESDEEANEYDGDDFEEDNESCSEENLESDLKI